jgi:hypothetical protein
MSAWPLTTPSYLHMFYGTGSVSTPSSLTSSFTPLTPLEHTGVRTRSRCGQLLLTHSTSLQPTALALFALNQRAPRSWFITLEESSWKIFAAFFESPVHIADPIRKLLDGMTAMRHIEEYSLGRKVPTQHSQQP